MFKKELTIKLEDLIDAIESVETGHSGDQDKVVFMFKTDLLKTLGFIDHSIRDIETVKKLLGDK